MTTKHLISTPVSMTSPLTSSLSASFHNNLDLSTQALLLKHSFLQKLVADLQVSNCILFTHNVLINYNFYILKKNYTFLITVLNFSIRPNVDKNCNISFMADGPIYYIILIFNI